MNVCLATYQSISLLRGGPRTQIFETKRYLEDLDAHVTLFDAWGDFKREDVDLVHLFGANIGTYHLAREFRKVGVPMVVTPIFYSRRSSTLVRAGLAVDRLMRKLKRGVWTDPGFTADICTWARVVLPNTQAEAHLIQDGLKIPVEKIHVVPNGVDERFLGADPSLFKEQYGIERFVLNVGHIGMERKNVLRLIRALEKVNVPAVIIGRIERTAAGCACVEEAKRNPRLLVLDQLPNSSDVLASAYAACDVFVLPSQFETPGIAALEAALAGAKIVITPHGGTKEYFGSYAEYVEPTSVELIRHGIITALNKPKDSSLREHIKKNFLWQRVAEKTLAAYEHALSH